MEGNNDKATINAKLPGDPLDRFLWLALSDGVQFNGSLPFHAGKYMTDYLSDQAVAAIKANRNRPFFLYLAYNAPHTPLQAAKADYDALDAIGDERTRVYAAMIRALDRGVRRVTAELKAQGLERDTIVIFTNDNGGEWLARNEPLFHRKQTLWEGGIRVPALVRWPGRIPAGRVSDQVGITMDLTASILAATGTHVPDSAR